MKKIIISLIVCTFFLFGFEKSTIITVMNYNVHSGRGIDKKLDLDRIAAVITKENPDIVSLNEIEKNVNRSNCVDQIAYIAKKTNMYYAFGPNLIGDNGCGAQGQFGNAILSKYKIITSGNHSLYRQSNEEPRGCLEAEIEIDGKKIAFLSTHLDCHRQEDIRNNQAKDILKIIKQKELPVIFAGDMNAYIRSDGNNIENAAKIFSQSLYDSANANPTQKNVNTLINGKNRIDYIFVNNKLADSVLMYKVINYGDGETASDHYPVIAKIKI
jgi:endonuclease/exonuclease/phosphatase family metal-dependent hydrolase